MSTTLQQSWLKVLRRLGVRHFRATSGLGHPFICHLGDLAGENPFYNPEADRSELTVMAAWCSGQTRPIIFDVGANLGFISTQLVQMLRGQQPLVVAFEPVWSTFAKLKQSVRALGLEEQVWPVCCALSDHPGFASIAFDEAQSLFAQLRADTTNARVGRKLNWVPTQTLDAAVSALGVTPTLLKIDVEGFEAHVLHGARALLSSPTPPAILLEWNPLTMGEVGAKPEEITAMLPGWSFFYLDDFEGQRRQFLESMPELLAVAWICNVFAVPPTKLALDRWSATCEELKVSHLEF